MKLLDLLERGHCVQLEKRHGDFEIIVFEHLTHKDHDHTDKAEFADAVEEAHQKALARWPREGD